LRTSEQILDLKICDPAVGSGAILVAAGRYLADRLIEAWEAEGAAESQAPAEEVLVTARRAIADRCLYGVDKNPLAVGLAKLALWLESYAEGLPLTFMDHRLVAGDSLTGPFLEHLATLPGRGEKMSDDLFEQAGAKLLGKRIAESLGYVRALEASVGKLS
jgi:type II restriction/modification system DNA methylase subunit YeeA